MEKTREMQNAKRNISQLEDDSNQGKATISADAMPISTDAKGLPPRSGRWGMPTHGKAGILIRSPQLIRLEGLDLQPTLHSRQYRQEEKDKPV